MLNVPACRANTLSVPASERADINANPLRRSVLIDEVHLPHAGFGKAHFKFLPEGASTSACLASRFV
jgi:hypothetical protein